MNHTNASVSTHEKGNWGEDRAAEYLLTKGYKIICRRYRFRKGEIDCIAYDPDGTLVFIEVKSSLSKSQSPLFWVTPAKQRTIFRVAQHYLAEHNLTATPCRFDVIALNRGVIDHLRNAFIRM
jgi:putative endonuclease